MDSLALHRAAFVIDGHNDTLVAHIRRGLWSLSGDTGGAEGRHAGTIAFLRGAAPAEPVQINLPTMRAGGIHAGLFAIDVTLARCNHLAYALDGFGYLLRDLEHSQAEAVIVRTAADLHAARAAGKLALILAVEHADVTERSLNILRMLFEVGVRSIGLTHNVSSAAADGCLEARDGVGLTQYGVALVREMNALGMVVDLAHASPGAFFHGLEVSGKPVIFSHGNARALCDHPRNLSDDQLRALAQHGGVIGLSFVPYFVDAQAPSLERWLEHVDHIASVAGIEAVGLGSDFDGGGTLLRDATELPSITEGLLRRGYTEPDIRKVL
ncbi:MAG: membrane dipeptidase, partial [Chloroflexota bacterium]